MDSQTLWIVRTGVTVILSVASGAIAVIAIVSRLTADRGRQISEVRSDLTGQIAAVRSDLSGQIGAVNKRIDDVLLADRRQAS